MYNYCNPTDCSPPGLSVHGISQARILKWVAISFSRDLPDSGIEPGSPALADRFFTTEPPGKPSFLFLVLSLYKRIKLPNSKTLDKNVNS